MKRTQCRAVEWESKCEAIKFNVKVTYTQRRGLVIRMPREPHRLQRQILEAFATLEH